jgi:hypothetical protein
MFACCCIATETCGIVLLRVGYQCSQHVRGFHGRLPHASTYCTSDWPRYWWLMEALPEIEVRSSPKTVHGEQATFVTKETLLSSALCFLQCRTPHHNSFIPTVSRVPNLQGTQIHLTFPLEIVVLGKLTFAQLVKKCPSPCMTIWSWVHVRPQLVPTYSLTNPVHTHISQ